MTSIQLRPVPSECSDPYATLINAESVVVIKHPGYPDEFRQNELLMLYAWDIDDEGHKGLHKNTVLTASMLVACNSWNGYLSTDREGHTKVNSSTTNYILPPGTYYFHVPYFGLDAIPNSPYKYPIYPCFEHWTFPHAQLPPTWNDGAGELSEARETGRENDAVTPRLLPSVPSVSSATAAILSRDKACILSKDIDYRERAHLCPRNEIIWFRKNGMASYNIRQGISGNHLTDDIANALAMRPDIHKAFDACKFAIVRKNRQWVAHFLATTDSMGIKFHNMPINVPAVVRSEFILARFAWVIFPAVKSFMEFGPPRLVKVRVESGGNIQEIEKTMTSAEFSELEPKPSRSRSYSPRKRTASSSPLTENISSLKRRRLKEPSLIEVLSLGTEDRGGRDTSNENLGDDVDERSEESVIETLRMRELRKRRPNHNPTLLCCDYTLAEKKDAAGICGPAEYGGGHLCMECLGGEESL